MVVVLIDLVSVLREERRRASNRVSLARKILKVMNLDPDYAVSSVNGLLNFIVDKFSACRLRPYAHHGNARTVKAVVDKFFDSIIALLFRFLPK